MAKDFKNALKKMQESETQEQQKEEVSVFYSGSFHVELINGVFYQVFDDTEELRELQEQKGLKIEYKKLSQEELKEIYLKDSNKPIGELLKDYTNTATQQAQSYTLKATKPLLDLLRGLALVEKTTIKDLIINALVEYIKNAPEQEQEQALQYKKQYLD